MESMYESYLASKRSLTFEEAEKTAEQMEEMSGLDKDAEELYGMMLERCAGYLSIRAGWRFLSNAEKISAGGKRTMAHNAMISSMNAYSRYIEKKTGGCPWKNVTGDPGSDPAERKRIGDLGCYMGLLLSLNER